MANEKILVVDDELSIRLALKTAFVREGIFDWYLKNSFIDQFILKHDLASQLAGMLN